MMVSDSVFLWVFLCGHVSLAVFMLPVLFLFSVCFIIALYLPFFLKRERPHLSCRRLHDKHCVWEHGGLRNWSS